MPGHSSGQAQAAAEHRLLCQTRERDRTPVTPATDAGAPGPSHRQQNPVFMGVLIFCSPSRPWARPGRS